jgi:hypothetical protein
VLQYYLSIYLYHWGQVCRLIIELVIYKINGQIIET